MKLTCEEVLDAIKRAREDEKSSKIMEAIDDVVIDALEKNIPAEVLKEGYRRPCCPRCGNMYFYGEPDNYCWICGQRLDWGGK